MDASPLDVPNFHQRASKNFQVALLRLQNITTKSASLPLDQLRFEFPIDTAFKVETGARQLENAAESLITEINKGNQMPPPGNIQMVKDIVKRWMKSSSPFALTFLTIAKEGACVLISFKRVLIVDSCS